MQKKQQQQSIAAVQNSGSRNDLPADKGHGEEGNSKTALFTGETPKQQICNSAVQVFERSWEKQNGIKLYMLDYQKRKEIRKLFSFSRGASPINQPAD